LIFETEISLLAPRRKTGLKLRSLKSPAAVHVLSNQATQFLVLAWGSVDNNVHDLVVYRRHVHRPVVGTVCFTQDSTQKDLS